MTCDRGVRAGLRSDERERLKALEREVRELRRADEILRKASAYLSTFGRQQHRHLPRRSSTAAREDDVVHRCGVASLPWTVGRGFSPVYRLGGRPVIPVPVPTPVRAPRGQRRATFSGGPHAGRARAGETAPASVALSRVQGAAGRGSEQLGSPDGEGGKGDGGLDADNPLQDAKLGFRGERFEVGVRH